MSIPDAMHCFQHHKLKYLLLLITKTEKDEDDDEHQLMLNSCSLNFSAGDFGAKI